MKVTMNKFIIPILVAILIWTVDAAGPKLDKSPSSKSGNAKPAPSRTDSNPALSRTNSKPALSRTNSKPATNTLPKKMVRVPILNAQISPELIEINKRLSMDAIKKELTKKQADWIERFVTTIKNWLYFVDLVLKLDKFQELYKQHLQKEFDMWFTGRKDQAFDMYYKDENNPKAPPIHYKIIIYRVNVADLALVQNLNLKTLEIGFERSKEKLKTPKGEMVYRKDRVYVMELEAELPLLDVKFRHEIVYGKEKGDFDPYVKEDQQDVKPGYLRMRMSNVKLYIKVLLTEIDKRFVQEEPDTDDEYYFKRPEIVDFKFTMSDAELFEPEFQKKPKLQAGLVGENLPQSRAAKILKDFAHFLVLKENEREFNHRLKIALINRFSEAIMLTTDIMMLPANLDREIAFYSPVLPVVADEEDMVLGCKVFYMSYSIASFISTCKYFLFKALEFQSLLEDDTKDKSNLTPEQKEQEEKKEEELVKKLEGLGKEAEQWMEDQAQKADKGLGIRSDGFDWDEEL